MTGDNVHVMYILLSMHTKQHAENFVTNFQDISDSLDYALSTIRTIDEYEISLCIPDVENGAQANRHPNLMIERGEEDKVIRKYLDDDDIYPTLGNYMAEVRKNFKKGSVCFEYCVEFSFDKEPMETLDYLKFVEKLFNVFDVMLINVNHYIPDLSYLLYIDNVGCYARKHDDRRPKSLRSASLKLMGYDEKNAPQEIVKEIKDGINDAFNKETQGLDIPEEFLKSMTKGGILSIVNAQPKVTINPDGTVDCVFPETRSCTINQVKSMCYFCYKFLNDESEKRYTVRVEGTMNMFDDILDGNWPNWFHAIEYIKHINATGADFKSFNTKLFTTTYVDSLMINNPVIQPTKKDSDVQECVLFNKSWKNRNVELTSHTHELDVMPDPKATFKTILVATKKK